MVTKARMLSEMHETKLPLPTVGVFAAGDPRIDEAARKRTGNIVRMAADVIAAELTLPDGAPVPVVWSPVLVDGEAQADLVASRFRAAGVNILVCVPDTWAFPQLSVLSLLSQFPEETPLNITCGNSAPKPGVVFAHATNGALAQSGRLCHLNVGSWPDTGANPKMSNETAKALIDWCFAAVARVGLRGRRVVVFGHDSMGMETALAQVIPTRRTFGLEITRLDMKLVADMIEKKAYSVSELSALRHWIDKHMGKRLKLTGNNDGFRFNKSLALYLVVRDLLRGLNAVGGGFMSQLEWGSDLRGLPLPVPDVMESLLNTSFDHEGPKTVMPFATEADVQGLLTMLFFTWLSGGNPPLFMDFRKVWEPAEIRALAKKVGAAKPKGKCLWWEKGVVDGNNSGSASFDWAAKPGTKAAKVMAKVSMPPADAHYFPGGGNSVTFISPGGLEGIAGRIAFHGPSNRFSLIWDEASTVDLPAKLARAVSRASDPTWPHTFVVPKYASMTEYKQYAPANHLHMTWGLTPARVQFWMDLAAVRSVTPWAARPGFVEGTDRPEPLLNLIG